MRHAFRNLAVALINAAVLALVFAGLNVALAAATESRQWGLLNILNLPAPVHIAAAIVFLDGWSYWWHRATHVLPLLWRFHRMHHSDDAMDVTTATRFHLGEILISAALRLPLIPLIGIPIEAIVVYDLTLLAATQFHHSNIGLRGLDRAIQYLLVSPNMHKVHHSQARIETDSNYASILSIWDRLFGTFRQKGDYGEIRFGLPAWSGPRFQSLRGMLATPLVDPSDSER
ncbi:MAG: sterol desaturase family protein [bacterium]|nr:sterol desaturase family protein [bacterium]